MKYIIDILEINPLSWTSVATALFCGGIVGLERQLAGKPAGMRTSMLICIATYAFVTMGKSIVGESVDSTRIIGQIVTGIGFLGAGVMLTREGLIIGVTSASVIWVLAAIGSLIGLGNHGAAIILSFVTLFVLIGVNTLESLLKKSMKKGVHND